MSYDDELRGGAGSGPPADRDGAHPPYDDETAARIRAALAREAAGVRPAGDGLARIRERTERGGVRAPWWRPAAAVAAALALAAVAGGVFLTLRPDEGSDSVVAVPPTASSAPASPTPTASALPSPTTASAGPTNGVSTPDPSGQASPGSTPQVGGSPDPTSTAPGAGTGSGSGTRTAAAAIYYLGDHSGDIRLYREFHRVTAGPTRSDLARQALQEMLRGSAQDPDYTSLWPRGTRLLGYERSGGTATVDLSAEALDGGGGADAEAKSLQQLVYTATAAEQDTGLRVRLLVEGRAVTDLWGHGSVTETMRRAPTVEVQGLLWILSPAEGATVSSSVTVEIFGTANEANVVVEAVPTGAVGSRETVRGIAMVGGNGTFASGTVVLELPPGDYELRVNDTSGEDGSLLLRDSKNIRAR